MCNTDMTQKNSKDKGRDRDMVSALAKGLAIIEIFDEQRRSVTISEAAVLTNMTRAAARRYLLSLVQLGYMSHDGKNFFLTPRVMRLGHRYLAITPLSKLLHFYVEELAEETGESITAAILEDGEALVVAHREPLQGGPVKMAITVGTRLPLYSTAIGRIFLAFGPQDWAKQYLSSINIIKRTPKSLADKNRISMKLDETKLQGYSIIDEEMEIGLRSIAVPIKNSIGQVRAAITISGNAGKYTTKQFVSYMLPILSRVQESLANI